MDEIKLASLGDCCIDTYTEYDEIFPGGTAFNVAAQAIEEGAQPSIFSVIGQDAHGILIKDACKKLGIDTSNLLETTGRTSTIDIVLDEHKRPTFSNWEIGVLKDFVLSDAALSLLGSFDVARVVLFTPMKRLFEQFCTLTLTKTMKAADFAGASSYTEGLEAIETYVTDLDVIIQSLDEQEEDKLKFFQSLSVKYPEKIFLALRGLNGSSVFYNSERIDQPAISTDVQDTNGAGDAFVGSFLVNYCSTKDIQYSLFRGTLAASQTITHRGAHALS